MVIPYCRPPLRLRSRGEFLCLFFFFLFSQAADGRLARAEECGGWQEATAGLLGKTGTGEKQKKRKKKEKKKRGGQGELFREAEDVRGVIFRRERGRRHCGIFR